MAVLAIDVTTPNSPGWWMQVLWQQMRGERDRLDRLHAYRVGQPPLVHGTEEQRSAFYRFQKTSRSNFADMICTAMTDRQAVRSIRTAAANDDDGDAAAWAIFAGANLDVYLKDVLYDMASLSVGYLSLGLDADGKPVIVPEDPRQVTHAIDPLNPLRRRAGFKVSHDPLMGIDQAILWLPGQKWIATRARKARAPVAGARVQVSFSAASYSWAPFTADSDLSRFEGVDWATDDMLVAAEEGFDGLTSETYAVQKVALYPFVNRKGVGEYELHTDLIDRIHHMVLQRLVIATFQAFRQKALIPDPAAGEEGRLPEIDPNTGLPINYTDVFAADPGAAWLVPPGMKIWESTEVDLSGILNSTKADVQDLGAVTRTPFPMFSSDATNQSAEGANLTREGLTFKVEDRNGISGRMLAELIGDTFAFLGDTVRADASKIILDWQPAERHSLSERSQADSQALSLPDEQKYRLIWGMSPAEARIAVSQKAAQDARQAAFLPAPTPAPVVPLVDVPAVDGPPAA